MSGRHRTPAAESTTITSWKGRLRAAVVIFAAVLTLADGMLPPHTGAQSDVAGSTRPLNASTAEHFEPSGTCSATLRLFPETGKSVRGRFLAYWQDTGGLTQYGYPITDELLEYSGVDGKPYAVQYFERSVFEYHPENKPPYDVLLQLLGRLSYAAEYPSGAPNQLVNTNTSWTFKETGKTVGGRFLRYWQQTGAVMRHGFPISDEFQQVSRLSGKTYTVQYFERSVFEYHPENKSPYDVLLAQLGTLDWQKRNRPWKPPSNSSVGFLPDVLPDGEYIPLFAGTTRTNIYSLQDKGYSFRRLTYTPPSPPDDGGYRFYSEVLPNLGWQKLDRRQPTFDTYALPNPSGEGYWYLLAALEASPGDKGITGVTIDYRRMPERTDTPLYPGSYNIEVSRAYSESANERRIITETTYFVDAQPEAVTQYYKDRLPTYGWEIPQAKDLEGHYFAMGETNANGDPDFRIDGLELYPTASRVQACLNLTRVDLRLSAIEYLMHDFSVELSQSHILHVP